MREGQKTSAARRLRRDMTDAERALWRQLRARNLSGHKFRRQHPVGPYVVDFACLEAGLVVEVDGGQHADARSDVWRDAFLRHAGFRILRFWNNEVLGNIEGVCDLILQRLMEAGPHRRSGSLPASVRSAERPHPNLPPQAGEGAGSRER